MFTSSIYSKSPIVIQNTLLSFRALLRKLIRERHDTDKSMQLSEIERDPVKLKQFTASRLEGAISNAIENTTFYRDIKSGGISHFKLISKKDVVENQEKFRSYQRPKIIVNGATSGTTGSPLEIQQDLNSVLWEQAFVARHLQWAGYQKGDRRAWLRGDMIVPLAQKTGPFWRYSWFEDMIMLSSFHMTQEALPLYIKALIDFQVDIIQAYPSSIVTLAKYLESRNEFFARPIKSIITSSEMLTEEDRCLIQERFNCPVFDWYGLFERVAAIAMCEHGRYHILTDYSFVELMPTEDGKFEIIGTNFNNRYQPLIRYKTGDHVVLSDEEECPCGRAYPIVRKIEGRVGDYLLAEDGQKVFILNHIPKGVDGLLSCQFIQDQVDLINILVVVDKNRFDDKQEAILISNARARLGNSINFVVTPVDALPRTRNGKVRQAVCNVELN